jgi:hypothetical protein
MLRKNPPAKDAVIRMLITDASVELPEEYLAFLRVSNGGELDVELGRFDLWPAEEIVQANRELRVEEFLPGFFVFGGDGANELLAFDTRGPKPWAVYMVPMIVMSEDDAVALASDFASLIAA